MGTRLMGWVLHKLYQCLITYVVHLKLILSTIYANYNWKIKKKVKRALHWRDVVAGEGSGLKQFFKKIADPALCWCADRIDPIERKEFKREGRTAGVVTWSRWEASGSGTQVQFVVVQAKAVSGLWREGRWSKGCDWAHAVCGWSWMAKWGECCGNSLPIALEFFFFQGTLRRGVLAESEDAGEVLRDWRESGVEK